MSDASSIEWTDTTWNPSTGCDKVSPGCGLPRPSSDDEQNGQTGGCYAMTMARRLKAMGQAKYQNDGDPRTSGPGFGVTMHPDSVTAPLTWKKPRKVFVNSMSDLFHDQIDASFIAEVFAVMQLTPQHSYQLLTKRHARMRSLLNDRDFIAVVDDYREKHRPRCGDFAWPLPNVWLGVSVESQQWADIRIPALLDTPAAVRWISAEPLLGPVDLKGAALRPYERQQGGYWKYGHGEDVYGNGKVWVPAPPAQLDWVVCGGESGPGARPMHPAWARRLRDQCTAAGVAFHFKQWGAYGPLPKARPDGILDHTAVGVTVANDGTVYQPADLTYPDGPRYGEAIRAGHDKAALTAMYRVGKKTAGRELDGRIWDEFPGGAS